MKSHKTKSQNQNIRNTLKTLSYCKNPDFFSVFACSCGGGVARTMSTTEPPATTSATTPAKKRKGAGRKPGRPYRRLTDEVLGVRKDTLDKKLQSVGKKLTDGIYECTKTSARVWLMDAKPVDKKLRGGKVNVVLPLTDNEAMFSRLMSLDVKIGVASEATVICHFVHECFGNILEAAGVELAP
jgi:hypothetical protein